MGQQGDQKYQGTVQFTGNNNRKKTDFFKVLSEGHLTYLQWPFKVNLFRRPNKSVIGDHNQSNKIYL